MGFLKKTKCKVSSLNICSNMLNSLKLIFLQYEYKCITICFNDNGLYLHIKQLADRIAGL